MSVCGLSKILDSSEKNYVSKRVDSKEIKIESIYNDLQTICYTKETNMILNKKSYAVKLSHETGQAFFVPITSTHSITFLDQSNKSINTNDSQNMLYEDSFRVPNPSRNKHDQLCIEMKNHLYKPLSFIIQPDNIKQFLTDLFTSTSKRQSHILDTKTVAKTEWRTAKATLDMINCSYLQLKKVNLCDVKQINSPELQVEALLRKGQVFTFSEIQEILELESSKLLNILPTIGLLVLGNWTIKSNLLYKINPFQDSEVKQKHYKDLIFARDFLLWNIVSGRKFTLVDIHEKFRVSFFF